MILITGLIVAAQIPISPCSEGPIYSSIIFSDWMKQLDHLPLTCSQMDLQKGGRVKLSTTDSSSAPIGRLHWASRIRLSAIPGYQELRF